MQYPQLAKKLSELLEADQQEIRAYARLAYGSDVADQELQKQRMRLQEHSRKRAQNMVDVLKEIESPTISNIGIEGSEAVSVIALHSSLNDMKEVLKLFFAAQKNNPENIHLPAIPPLIDRILILERQKQELGTQWMQAQDGQPFLPPVRDFANVNKRRAKYDLEPLRRPRIVALENPKKRPPAKIPATYNDQREPTKEEYLEYSQDYLT